MMVLQWCVDIFNVIVEVWFGYWLFNVPKYRRFEQKWVRVLEYGCFIGLPGFNSLYDRMLGIRYSNVQAIFVFVLFVISAVVYTQRNIWYILAWFSIYSVTISLLELPGIVLSGWLTGQPYVNCIWQPAIYDYIYLFCLTCMLLIVYRRIKYMRNTIENIFTKQNSILWILFSIIEWWVITYFLLVGHTESGRDVFIYNIISIVLILVLLVSFSTLVIYRRSEIIKQERLFNQERRERIYEKIKDEYLQKSQELHDMKHRLQPIEGYLSSKQPDKALIYVKELLGDISKSQNRIHGWTGNPLVDSFLNSKADIAKRLNIDFHIQVSLLDIALSDKDMSVLLGNLLDNAIEAAKLCINEKWIKVHIVQKGNILFICIKNTYLRSPVEKQGKFESTKQNKEGHGWGMQSVRAIVENNGGDLMIKYDDKYFEVIALFFKCKL